MFFIWIFIKWSALLSRQTEVRLNVTLLYVTSDRVCRLVDSQLFMAFANLYMLGELGRQYLSGWANQTCVDTTFQFCNEAVNILTTGITEMQGVYHPTGAFIIPDGSESFLMYRNSLTALEIAAHALIADVQPCDNAGCKTCTFVRDINTEPEMKKFMKTKAAKAFTWPKHSLMGDEHKGITKLADHFKVEHNRCIYHKTSKFAHDFN